MPPFRLWKFPLVIERSERIKVLTITGLVLLVLVLLVALSYPFSGIVKIRLISLFGKTLTHTSRISAYPGSGSPVDILRKEKEELETRLRIMAVEFEEISRENERLREFLALKKRSKRQLMLAQVVGRDISNWSKTILINRGTNDGVGKGMIVISNSALAGKVIETGADISRVILLTDPESCVGCLIQGTRQAGLVHGTAGGRILMRYIDPEAEIEKGQMVVTSGFGGTYPKGLAVGKIDKIKQGGPDIYQNAWILPEVDFSRLEEVLVIIE